MKTNKGFTLIELLVVIAIIGMLSSIVLASLNSARTKGQDSAIKTNLANARSQAELYYETDGSNGYGGVCTASNSAGGVRSIRTAVTAAGAQSGYTAVSGDFLSSKVGNTTSVTCHANASAWAAEAPLKSGGMWCVDSTGKSTYEAGTSLPNSSAFSCI